MLGIADDLSFLVDDNKSRIGMLAPNYYIPVLSPEELKMGERLIIVILAWRFADLIISRLRSLSLQDSCALIPFKVPKVVKI